MGNKMTILSTFQPIQTGLIYAVFGILCIIFEAFMIYNIEKNNVSVMKGCSVIVLIALIIGVITFSIFSVIYLNDILHTEVLIDPAIIPPEFNNYTFIERRGDIWVLRSRIPTE